MNPRSQSKIVQISLITPESFTSGSFSSLGYCRQKKKKKKKNEKEVKRHWRSTHIKKIFMLIFRQNRIGRHLFLCALLYHMTFHTCPLIRQLAFSSNGSGFATTFFDPNILIGRRRIDQLHNSSISRQKQKNSSIKAATTQLVF